MVRRLLTVLLVLGFFAWLAGPAIRSALAKDKPTKKADAAKASPAKPTAGKEGPCKTATGKEASGKHRKKHAKKHHKHPGHHKHPKHKSDKHRPGGPPSWGYGHAGHRGPGGGFQPWGQRGPMPGPFGFGRGPFGRFGMQGPGFFGRGPWGRGPDWGPGGGRGGFHPPLAGKPPVERPSVDELFKRFDTNGDGSISKEEFAAGMKKMHERMRQRMGPWGGPRAPHFGPQGRPFDMRPQFGPQAGPSGMPPQFGPQAGPFGMPPQFGPQAGSPGMRPPFGPPTTGLHFGAAGGKPPGVSALFERFDKNKDGKLTKDEVPGPMWEHLSKADVNKDGAVTKEEFEAAHKKMQEHFRQKMTEEHRGKQPR